MKLVKHSQVVKDTQALRAIGRCLGVVGPVDLMVLALPSHDSQAGGATHRQLQVIERLDQYLIDQEWVSGRPLDVEKRFFLYVHVCDYLAPKTSGCTIFCWLELILNQFCFWSMKTVQATSQVLKTMFSSSLGNELKTLDKADIFQGLQPFFPKRKVKVYCYTRSIIMIFNTIIVCVINCIWIWRNENQMSVKSLSLIIY